MKVLVTGATGFIGKKLCEKLILQGHEVTGLTRSPRLSREKTLLPMNWIDAGDLKNTTIHFEAIFNLAGESIAGRWTQKKKEKILDSRLKITSLLVEYTKRLPVDHFISASAIGYYPESSQDSFLDESSEKAQNFLAEVCSKWEEEAKKALAEKIVILRTSLVLGHDGGMLKPLLALYRRGLGAKLADGKQWMSFVHVDDMVSAYTYSLEKSLEGTFNVAASNPVRNKDFHKVLCGYLRRPGFLSIPRKVMELLMGEASILALSSQRVSNEKIKARGFVFQYETLEDALVKILGFGAYAPLKEESSHYYKTYSAFLPYRIDDVFDFFSSVHNLEKITPDYLHFKVLSQSKDQICERCEFTHELKYHAIPLRWKTIIKDWKPNQEFVDYQEKGPYQVWYHTHRFVPVHGGVLMQDDIKFKIWGGLASDLLPAALVEKDVDKIFSYRNKTINKLLAEKYERTI